MINTCSKCDTCGAVNTFTKEQCEKTRKGVCEVLNIKCTSCETIARYVNTTSNTIDRKVDINLRSVYGITSAGCGLAALRTLSSAMNIPPPIYPHTCNKYIKYIAAIAEKNCQESMNEAARKLMRHCDEIANVSVSVDVTWQTRYGHNSLLGASFIISVNGLLLDYVIKSKTCQVCKRNPDASEDWK